MLYIWSYLKRYPKWLVLDFVAAIFFVIVNLGLPTVLARMIDEGINPKQTDRLFFWAWVMFGVIILGVLGRIVLAYAAGKLTTTMVQDMRNDLYEKLQEYSHHEYEKIGVSSLVTRMTSDAFVLMQFSDQMLKLGVITPIMMLSSILLILQTSPSLAWIVAISMPFLAVVVWYVAIKTKPLSERHVESDGLVFDPAQIIKRTANGVAVPHGDHYHFIPYSQMSDLEQKIARMIPLHYSSSHLLPSRPNLIPAPDPTPVPSPQPVPNPQSSPSNAIDGKLVKQAVRKVADGYVFEENGTSRYISTKELSAETVIAIDNKLSKQESLSHVLGAKKSTIPSSDQEFYNKVYDLLVKVHQNLISNKGRQADFDALDKLFERLNDVSSDKVKLVDDILTFLAPITHPERLGKPNAQIAYTDDEIKLAKLAGKYTTEDGYIFDPRDITSDEGDAYVTPHMTHSHWIKKESLSEAERAAGQAYAKEKGLTPPSTNYQSSGNTEAKGAEAIYNRVKAAKKVPLDRMPYNLQHTVEVKNGSLIIPHYDHYHNIKFEWFDEGLYEAPKGYTLEELFETVKYYVEHPNERPHSDSGWGNASDHVQRNHNSQATNNQTEKPTEEKPQTEKIEEEKPREEKPKTEKSESPKPKEPEESEEESPSEPEEPQVETEKVEEKLREAEELLKKIQDPILKSNANETLTGLKNNLLFGSQDNNTIMAEAEKLLVLLKESK